MSKQQVFLTIAGLLLVVGIFQLPRVVVENDTGQALEQAHSTSIRSEDRALIQSLKLQISMLSDFEKSANFADSLAGLYLKYQMADSAAGVAEWILQLDTAEFFQTKAGLIYSRVFQLGGQGAKEAAEKAGVIFKRLLEKDPSNLMAKNKLAMSLTVSENPMSGILMLREILEANPENREAIFNLGLLAIQSGQFDKAEERFQKLIELSDQDHEAYFYLGIVQKELGKTEESVATLTKYLEFGKANPALKATAVEFLKELNNI